MDLLRQFQKYLQQSLAIAENDRIIVAVSGGRDSMLMAYLFIQLGYDCCLAHCNFSLRGADSDADEALVRQFAAQYAVPCFVHQFDTDAYAKEKGISIQMAARDLRYAWFEALRQQENAQWIAIAQHQQDHIETTLINMSRGTGLRGLRGILPKQGCLIRPIMFLCADQITQQVAALDIPFRDDQSNFTTKYARNKIRIEVLPKLREVNPDFDAVMLENIANFRETYTLLQSFISPIRDTLFRQRVPFVEIEREELKPYLSNTALLYELFNPYGFSKEVLGDLQRAWDSEPGRRFYSGTHELLLDRSSLLLRPIVPELGRIDSISFYESDSEVFFGSYNFQGSVGEDRSIDPRADRAKIDYDKLVFPLTLRYWMQGDIFYPLGMQGKQKLSDYFVQKKISLFAKEHIPILLNGNGDIIWVVGYRLDNRYRIAESTKKVFTLVYK